MRITERILAATLVGSDWVLWLLIFLSILSVTIMVERTIVMSGRAPTLEDLGERLLGFLAAGDLPAARELLGPPRSPEVRVALVGLTQLSHGRIAAAEAMASARSHERLAMEKHLGILGTLGNNCPFIGLFGTVLGIIKAFADLSHNQGGGAAVVMAGIAEALVATAIGLLVAIPAVVAYNVFKGMVKDAVTNTESLSRILLAELKAAGSEKSE